ncbi:MAG: c-type cytochrome domain-containing protein [Verrucomicrobiota bacterium]
MSKSINPRLSLQIAALAGLSSLLLNASAVDYEQDIEPILQDFCIDCHGPDTEKSGFRVDLRAVMLKGGDSGMPGIVPGDPEGSFLIEVVKGIDPEMAMPPKGGPLLEEEIAALEQWITEGAPIPGQMDDVIEEGTDHWSFQPVGRPPVPNVDGHPVDAFLAERMTAAGIEPNGVS